MIYRPLIYYNISNSCPHRIPNWKLEPISKGNQVDIFLPQFLGSAIIIPFHNKVYHLAATVLDHCHLLALLTQMAYQLL